MITKIHRNCVAANGLLGRQVTMVSSNCQHFDNELDRLVATKIVSRKRAQMMRTQMYTIKVSIIGKNRSMQDKLKAIATSNIKCSKTYKSCLTLNKRRRQTIQKSKKK